MYEWVLLDHTSVVEESQTANDMVTLIPLISSLPHYPLLGSSWGSLSEDVAPIVGDLINSDCIVGVVISHLFQGDLIVGSACPTVGAID